MAAKSKQKYDWSKVPAGVDALTTDKDGTVYAWYGIKPSDLTRNFKDWGLKYGAYIMGAEGHLLIGVAPASGDWTESLEMRAELAEIAYESGDLNYPEVTA